jgi:hypothetical protein
MFHHYSQLPFPWLSSSSRTSCSTAEFSPLSFIHASSTTVIRMLFMAPAANLAAIPKPPLQVLGRFRPPSYLLGCTPVVAWKAWPYP